MILTATVQAAAAYAVPVTMKTRIGIDDDHQTFLDAGRIAEEAGCAAIALHGRTAQQAYSGEADWTAIAALKAHVSIPVLGNGDIWEARDAQRMVAETGADGVVIGRGCLGRPWLFRDLAAAFAGQPVPPLPVLGEVTDMMRRHARLLVGLSDERHGCAEFRKHVSWYLKGFPAGGELRRDLAMVSSLADLDQLLNRLDPAIPYRSPSSEAPAAVRAVRGVGSPCRRAGSTTPPAATWTSRAPSWGSPVADGVPPGPRPGPRPWAGTRRGSCVRAHRGSAALVGPGPLVHRELRSSGSARRCDPAPPWPRAPGDGPSRSRPTRSAPASSGTAIGSCTPRHFGGWPARPRSWSTPATTSGPG